MKLSPGVSLAVACSLAGPAWAQDLGHKLPGGIGLDAGRAPRPGVYLSDRILLYQASQLRDRNGALIADRGGSLRIRANVVGVSAAVALPWLADTVSATVAVPVAWVNVTTERAEASLDQFGITDVYVNLLRLGWYNDALDGVASYAVYLPTGRGLLAGGEGLSAGHITHEFAAGGSACFGGASGLLMGVLVSYELNLRKRGIDITRGDTIQAQGGVGARLFEGAVELGLAAYWLQQVRDDRGTDVPAVLRGARDRVVGWGPEAAVAVKPLRARLRLRYERDLIVRARPEGGVLLVALDVEAWRPGS